MLNNAKLPSPSPTPPPASTERVSVKNPCGELEAILLRLAAQIDSEREAQGLSVAELARQARLGRRTLTYGCKVQSAPRLSTLLAQAKALNLRLVVRCERRDDGSSAF